jgi:pSer/pThr/pTyr-binding forkhead associated (FHA) protein
LEQVVEAKLVVVSGETQARQYDLQLPTVIGRSRTTDLRLGHPLVSRQHCEIFESNGMLMVRDLGSLNGTFIGETRIAEGATPVKPGDLLSIGPVTFRAVYRAGSGAGQGGEWNAGGPTLDDPLVDPLEDTGPPEGEA